MRLHEIALREDGLGGLDEGELLALIRRDCRPFLESDAGRLMYRGMQSKPSHAFKQAVRTDRKPRNMKHGVHDAIDAWFKEKFGFRARSETVFVSGDFADAKSYGKVYAVLPIGDFEFVWSPDVGDLFIMFHAAKPEDVARELEELNYTDDQLGEALDSRYEVMVKCKEYYAVPIEDWQAGREFLNKLRGTE